MRARIAAGCVLCILSACRSGGAAAPAADLERCWEIGYRGGVGLGDGEPSNDIPIPVGVFGRYRWSERWATALSLELAKGDYERPYEIAGLQSTQEIDGEAEWTTLALWCERTFSSPESRNAWFVALGLGYAGVDVEDPSPGPLLGGGTFDIETDAEDEVIVSVGAGYRRRFDSAWALEATLRYDEHLTDWDVRDLNTGATGSVDDYGVLTFLFGVTFGF